MNELWDVLSQCKLAKTAFTQTNGLTDCLVIGESNKQLVMRLGVAQRDQSAVSQWKSKTKPPRPLRSVANKFHDNLAACLEKSNRGSIAKPRTLACQQGAAACQRGLLTCTAAERCHQGPALTLRVVSFQDSSIH